MASTSPDPPGPLIARGRDADVFDIGGGKVLRRYRQPRGTLEEAAVMEHVRAHGFGVPAVHEVTATDMIMDRAAGPTMLADLGKRPWLLRRHARTLAALHDRLHRIPALAGLPAPLGDGDVVVHLDLHPDNVICTPDGPVVIDWANAARGIGAADVAQTWIVLATSQIPGSRRERTVATAGRRLFIRAFLSHFDRAAVERHLPTVARHRMRNPNVTDAERDAIRSLAPQAAATGERDVEHG